MSQVTQGEGYSVANLDDLGAGPGFRKIRPALGVEEFGINAIVMPPGIESSFHYHETQEELYFVHSGVLDIQFGDGTVHKLGPGGIARVAAETHRQTRNSGDVEVVYVVVGAKDGYVGRDGMRPDYETGQTARPIAS